MADKKPAVDTTAWTRHGRNVRAHMEGSMLFIAVDTSADAYKNLAPTQKGNMTIASTLGNVAIDGTSLKMGLNLYGPPPAV